jgi:hypothetical protein
LEPESQAPQNLPESDMPSPVPVLHLRLFQMGGFRTPFTVASSAFEAHFCDPLPAPQVLIAITERILIDEAGRRRPFHV